MANFNMQTVILGLYFVFIVAATYIGVKRNSKATQETKDFGEQNFRGGGKVGAIALAVIVSAGTISTGTFIACLGKSANVGPGYLLLLLNLTPITFMVLATVGKRASIIVRRYRANSVLDLYYYRYGKSKLLLYFCAACTVIFSTVSAAGEFTGGSRVIEYSAGIPYRVALIVFAIVITLYTTLGGMTGVSIVGLVQGFMMTFGSLVLLIGYSTYFGGIGGIFQSLAAQDVKLLTPNIAGGVTLIGTFEYWVMYGNVCAGLPWSVQGAITYDNTKTMKRAMIIGTIMLTLWQCLFACFGGAAARALEPALADPARIDYATATLATGVLPGPLAGIVLAAAAGAGQSTIGAIFICIAAAVVQSVYKTVINPEATNEQQKTVMRITTLVVGVGTVALALTEPATLHIFLNLAEGALACTLFPAIMFGLYWPRATKEGMMAGMIFGVIFYTINYMWDIGIYPLHECPMCITLPIVCLIVYLVSKRTPAPDKETIRQFYCKID